jgi:hypothetical protein
MEMTCLGLLKKNGMPKGLINALKGTCKKVK